MGAATDDAAFDPLPPAFCERDALSVARDLLGRYLVRDSVVLRITEVEAYRWPDDTASHANRGQTRRNAPMFGPPGHAYVYLCYGLHQMLNVVARPEGEAAAVLIRACEPVEGLDVVAARRGGRRGPDALTGPGKVGAALAIDTSWSGHPLWAPGGLVLTHGAPADDALEGPRVGIDYAEPAHRDAPWRLAVADCRWVSHRRSLRGGGR